MNKTLIILSLIFLVSCSNEVPIDKLVERNGITYEVNSNTPFTGSSVSYFENGELQYRRNFKDGKHEGLWESFDEEGNLTKTEEYKDGVLQE